jgi:hypothetical protein
MRVIKRKRMGREEGKGNERKEFGRRKGMIRHPNKIPGSAPLLSSSLYVV